MLIVSGMVQRSKCNTRDRIEAYHRESCGKLWVLATSSCRTIDFAASFDHGISRIGHKKEIRARMGAGKSRLEPLGERGASEDHLLHFGDLQERCLYYDKGRWDPGDMVGIEVMVPLASLH